MRKILFVMLLWSTSMVAFSQNVKIEFFTPSIVHVVKGQPTKSLVVIAKPQQVSVIRKGNNISSKHKTKHNSLG